MDANDIYKLHIEDYARERESLRSLEWKTFFQLYVGFGTLAVALPKLHDRFVFPRGVYAVGLVAIFALWAAGVLLLSGIHSRMKCASELKRAYFKRLHETLQSKAEFEPSFWKYWASFPQHALLFITLVGFVLWWSVTCFG